MKKAFYYDTYVGNIGIAEENGEITDIVFASGERNDENSWIIEETEVIKEAKKQLDEYFVHKRKDFDFPTHLEGTQFQKSVWNALRSIPYGRTVSYKYIAELVGCPKGFRAVGLTNNKNPIPIVYPCHRVIGSDGSLVGYGGGTDIKRRLLALERQYVIGIDVGGTEIKAGIFDKNGNIVAKGHIATKHDDNCAYIFNDIADEIDRLINENGIYRGSVSAIGVGVPGPVCNSVVKNCVNLNWYEEKNVSAIMEKLTGIKTFALNDANAAALGESWVGTKKKNILLVTIGTGVGGGIITDGRVLEGAYGSAGEIGHITVEYENGRKCNCGKRGCLETYASATGIVKTAKEILAANDMPSLLREKDITAKTVFKAAEKGDKAALTVVESFGKYLGQALANAACIIDPDEIILAGGVSQAGKAVKNVVSKYYKKNAFKTVKNTKIKVSELKNDAGIYGAAKFALDKQL